MVSLEDSNKFTFTYSVLSSYIGIGSYEVDDGNLILKQMMVNTNMCLRLRIAL